MTEKEKLKEIIETALGFHDYYKVVVTEKDIDRLADKLIENGIRDITEKGVVAVEGEVSIVPENFVADIKFALDGNVDELKRRAEVAEKELEKHKKALKDMCKEYEKDIVCLYQDGSCEDECYLCGYNNRLRIAEREIEEEGKK